jgi:rod shape-determining protein MreC
MAPPSNRRSGHSKRAQYTNFIGYVAAIGGALVGGVLLLVSTSDATAFSGLRGIAADAAAPASKVTAAGRTQSQGFFAALSGYFLAGSENARLRREVAEARVRLAEAKALEDENRRLKALLGLNETDPKPVAIARLIGSTSSSTRRFAILGAGSSQGVEVGMPVRSPLGLVGRVLESGSAASRVLLITDSESVVPVKRASDGVPAFANGRGDGTIQLRLISLGINPLKKGDAFVTSGSGGLYRPGTAVAVVVSLTPDGAIAQPLSDPGTTEFVAVEPRWEVAAKAEAIAPARAGTP